jgi:hypothetical protein
LSKSDHPLALATDGYVVKELWKNSSMKAQCFSKKAVAFIAKAAQSYSQLNPEVPFFTHDKVC